MAIAIHNIIQEYLRNAINAKLKKITHAHKAPYKILSRGHTKV